MQSAQGDPAFMVPLAEVAWLGYGPNGGTSIGIERNIDGDLAKKLAFSVKDLYPAVAAIRYVDISCGIDRDAMRHAELTGLVPGLAP